MRLFFIHGMYVVSSLILMGVKSDIIDIRTAMEIATFERNRKEPELLSGNEVSWTFINFAGEDHTNFQALIAFLRMLSILASSEEGASKVFELLQGKAFRSVGWNTLFDCLSIYDQKFKQSLQSAGTMLHGFQEGDAKALVPYLSVLQKPHVSRKELGLDPTNGAYYGPPIPPKRDYHRPGRLSGCCILSALFKLIFTIVVVLGIAALVIWLVLRPSKVKVHVDSATLTQFNLTNSNNLYYNLSLDIAIRNPNKRIGIYHDKLEANAYYEGQRFDYVPLPTFYEGHKNTTSLYPVFTGQAAIPLQSSDVVVFNRENGDGLFSIDVKIYARIRFKIGSIKTNRYKPSFKCELRVPLMTSCGSSAVGFTRRKCDIDF
ncbi:NDR1/HIN1-like protein 10 [Magnolia sinica]|uniref:NDR1/HIN1-like protein 10 n=1 Tax=Magnolia sinica TaxID=86752 RepID=UPI0026586855|nr:NDR1/HIN1-like protein 10 [Magnolia sinica]